MCVCFLSVDVQTNKSMGNYHIVVDMMDEPKSLTPELCVYLRVHVCVYGSVLEKEGGGG